MLDARRRPEGRFFYWLLSAFVGLVLVWSGVHAPVVMAAGPATTRISDVVYRADGSLAAGVVLISWPAFTAADGTPVAAGSTSVALGNDGTLEVDLIPNAGATPPATYYTAVFQLDDGVKTEYWLVGTTSPTALAAVRAVPGTGVGSAPPASRQYVDSGLAATRAYVDSAVATVGSGSYVSKAGDAMSGPLTLPSDPSGSNQAATKHYVDAGLSAKANLVTGVVPPAQLGAGTADGTQCLKGNSSWGACGTSSNATTIQNVAVDATAPTDGQVITYEAASAKYKPKMGAGSGNATALQGVPVDPSTPADGQVVTYDGNSGKYKPKPGSGLSAAQQAPRYAGDFAFSQSPSTDLSSAGAKTVTLASCPAGVVGSSKFYYVYVSGTGTPEAALVTGGTCAGDGNGGTLQFTTSNGHAAGYTLTSATGGIQEASIAAQVSNMSGNNYNYKQGGSVRVGPGQFQMYAPLTILVPNQTIDFSGSTIACNFDADCINVGDQTAYNNVNNITLVSPKGIATIPHGQHSFITVWGQKTRIYNLSFLVGKVVGGVIATFGSYVTVASDQAFLLDGLNTNSSGLECNANFCGTAIKAPGPFTGAGGFGSGGDNSALGWLKNLNLDLQCMGNGVDWQSGNNVRITDSIIQGYPQFALRGGLAKGGYGMLTLENVYTEVGGCSNPAGNIGTAGVIVQGGKVIIHGGEGPDWKNPQFANTGSTDYRYFVVPYNSTYGYGNPLYIGHATTNGSGNINLTWPDIPTVTSVDVLKIPSATDANGDSFVGPSGTGNYAIATGLSRTGANCSAGVCSLTDTQAAPASYTVNAVAYFPFLSFWPGQLVLGPSGDGNSVPSNSNASLDLNDLNAISLWQNNTAGTVQTWQSISEGRCMPTNGSPVSVSCLGSSYMFSPMATLMMNKVAQDGGKLLNIKGRLNFLTGGSGPEHIVTLVDSNPNKTFATSGHRAPNDANDAYIGCDTLYCSGGNTGVTLGAPVSISNYIGNAGDGTSWKERLTGTAKTFTVNVMAPVFNATSGMQVGGSFGTSGQCLISTGAGSAWGACGSGGGGSASPLTAKGDLWGFSTTNARVPVGADGQCLVADSTNAVGVRWGACGQDSGLVHTAGAETIGGDKTFSGNVTVQGSMVVAGSWQVESAGPAVAMTIGAGDSKVGFDADGKLKVSENGGAVTEIAKVSQIPAAMAGAGSCNNKVVTATNVSAPPTCTTITSAYVDSSIPTTGTLVNGNYAKATGAAGLADSGVAAGPYTIPWLTTPRGGSTTGVSFSTTANQAKLWGVVLTFPVTTTQVRYYAGTADNTANVYDIGIYDVAGNLKAHTGPKAGTTFAPSATQLVLTWTAAITLQPGKYYLAITTNCTTACAALDGDNASGVTFQNGGAVAVTSGGTLNGSITPPADAWSWASYIPAWVIY